MACQGCLSAAWVGYSKMMEGTDLEDVIAEETDTQSELAAIVDGEATLSEEFKEKTSVIFEAAVKTKLSVLFKKY